MKSARFAAIAAMALLPDLALAQSGGAVPAQCVNPSEPTVVRCHSDLAGGKICHVTVSAAIATSCHVRQCF